MSLNYLDMVEPDRDKEKEDKSNEDYIRQSYSNGNNKLGSFLSNLNLDEDTDTPPQNNNNKPNEEPILTLGSSFLSKEEDSLDGLFKNSGGGSLFSDGDLNLDDDEEMDSMLKFIQSAQSASKNIKSEPEDSLLNIMIDESEEPINLEVSSLEGIVTDVKPKPIIETVTTINSRDIENEIISLTTNVDAISNFRYDDINNTVKNYLTETNNMNLSNDEYSLEIKDILKSSVANADMIALFEILNLKENKKLFVSDIVNMYSKLDSDYNNVKGSYETKKNNILEHIDKFETQTKSSLNKIYSSEINRLNEFKNGVENYLNINKQLLINEELNKHTELFGKVEDITKEVENIKSTIMNIMGKNFVKIKDEKIRIPRNEKELHKLLDKVTKEVEKLEIQDKSYYHRIITKAMRIIFAPSVYINNDMRSIIILMNTVAFLFLAIKFRDLFVIAFTSTIIIDLVNQIKMSKKNINADFVIEFAMKSNDIINNITNNLVTGITKDIDAVNKDLLSKLDIRIKELTDELNSKLDEKENEIENSYESEGLVSEVEVKYNRNLNALGRRYQDIKDNMDYNKDGIEADIDSKLKRAYLNASEIPNRDIYAEGNNKSLIFKPSVKVGRYAIEGGTYGFDFSRNLKEGSYLIRVTDKDMKMNALEKVKCLLVQHLSHIKPEYLKINLIDVKEMGNDLIEMVSENENITKLYPNAEALTEHLKVSVKEIEKRYKTSTKQFEDITTYNEEMIERNESTFKYEINLFYNFEIELIKNINFRTLMSEGGKSGLSSIVIIQDEEFLDQRGEQSPDLISALNCFDYNIFYDTKWKASPGSKDTILKGSIIPDFRHLESYSVQYDRNDTLMKITELEEIVEQSKKDFIYYEDLEKAYARDLFTKDTLKGIEICTGFLDGNMSKAESVVLGDDLVHALMGGKTGAGKSNTINVILMNLLRSYSPEWLELYMIDFKNLEFNFYTKTVETPSYTKKVCQIPHTSMIAGTTDGEYSLSVFDSALREMTRRKKILAKGIKLDGQIHTFKKIEDYNRFVIDNDLRKECKIIPRILIMLDEFQVMFTIDDDDVISKSKTNIQRLAKEARAMGMHMFFTSQSMSGTLSDDILGQFAMRWCLSATAETSKEVLGNSKAMTLPDKGFVYMSGTMERKEEDNKLFKVPFIPPDYINKVVKQVRDKALDLQKENSLVPFHKSDFYDEGDIHGDKELKAYLNHPTIKDNRNVIMLGQKVIYKDKATPEHFMLGNDDSENMVIVGNDKISVSNLLNGVIENVASKERTKLLIANFDRTMDGFINVGLSFEGTEVFNRATDPLPVLEAVADLIGINQNNDPLSDDYGEDAEVEAMPYNPNTDSRWYLVLIGLNKAQGFNEDYVSDEYLSPLINILKEGPSKGVTTIMNYKPPFRVNKMMPQFAHRLSSKVDEDISFELFGSRKAKNLLMDKGLSFGMYRSSIDDKEIKFKIYNFEYDKKLLQSKELDNVEL